MIAITGASGQLGQLVINHLLASVPAAKIVAAIRNPAKAASISAKGVQIRIADYNDSALLDHAFSGIERLLLISSSEVGQRAAQHRNVIDAAKRQNVKQLVYTSLLHADSSPLNLAEEHLQTEAMIKASGVPFIFLRNGWYTENYTASVPAALANGAFYGSARNGRISSASRADFAEAAAKVLTGTVKSGQIYELAGDVAYTLADLAAEISRQTGKAIPYKDLTEADFRAALIGAGLPGWLASGLASWDVSASKGALFDNSHQLRDLIGRPTTLLSVAVSQVLPK
jgi:NAD(P)H dehydrogenase (quinone)